MDGRTKSPLVLWHLLSLDAPTIAVLWTWFIAHVNRVPVSVSSLFAMAAAVWTLYAADRLLDVQSTDNNALEARHYFHQRHRTAFMIGIGGSSVLLATLLPHLHEEAIHLYLILGGLVFGYFVIIHATHSAHRLPKEIVVGVCFAAATFIPTIAREPRLRPTLLPPALLFAALCSLNCLFIYAWEHPLASGQIPHPITAIALDHLRSLTIGITGMSMALALFDQHAPWQLYAAVSVSTLTLLLLHQRRRGLSKTTLRAAADLALLTPLLLVPFL